MMENIDIELIKSIGGAIIFLIVAWFGIKKFRQQKTYFKDEKKENSNADDKSFSFNRVEELKSKAKIDINLDELKNELKTDLAIIEEKRRELSEKKKGLFLRAWYRTTGVIFIIFTIFNVISGINNGFGDGFFAVFVGIILMSVLFGAFLAGFYYLFKANSFANKYNTYFKTQFLPRVLKHLNESLEFSSSGISKKTFLNIGIFKNFNGISYSSEDTLKGKIGSTDIKLSEVYLQRRETRNSGGNQSTRYVKVFKGLVMEADFNKNMKGKTFMVPDFKDENDGSSGILMQGASFIFGKKLTGELSDFKKEFERVNIEDPDFEKFFNVYGSDQVEARYIYTPTFIELVKYFKDKLNKVVYMAFHGSKMYLLIDWNQNLFEPPPLKEKVENADFLLPIIQEIELATGFVEDFNLNQRIWNK